MQRSYEERMAEYDERLRRLKAERQALAARHATDERKARNHALIVAGGILMSCFADGWQSVDWPRLSRVVSENSDVFGRMVTDVLPTPEATRRLREFEAKAREAKKGRGEADGEDQGTGAGVPQGTAESPRAEGRRH